MTTTTTTTQAMTDQDLDRAYGALCGALAQVGEARAPLLLAMLSLSLLSRSQGGAEAVLPLIEQARAQCLAEDDGHGA